MNMGETCIGTICTWETGHSIADSAGMWEQKYKFVSNWKTVCCARGFQKSSDLAKTL